MAKEPADSAGAPRPRRKRAAEVGELNFNDDDIPPPRAGDPIDSASLSKLLPRRRARTVGLTGASVNADVTADDLSPETLLDEDGAESAVHGGGTAADTVLRRISTEETFAPPSDDPPTTTRRRRG